MVIRKSNHLGTRFKSACGRLTLWLLVQIMKGYSSTATFAIQALITATTTIYFSVKLHFRILYGPRTASASLGGPVHRDLIKYFRNELIT